MSERRDEFVAALEEMIDALEANIAGSQVALGRARDLLAAERRGEPIAELVQREQGARILDLIGENLDRLYGSGGRLRRAEANLLHSEGMSMERIAGLFKVSRQRISALLRER